MKDETSNQTDYHELYNRNWPIIPKDIQVEISKLRIGVAGCGSTGGAFIEGALRVGVQYFSLTDNGSYELNNLNRQLMTRKEIGIGKAAAHKSKISQVNPIATVKVWEEGLTKINVDTFLSDIDFLFDAVDVTTVSGIEMKLLLHEKAAQYRIPTGSALDLGFTQWLQSYNYHLGDKILHGKLAAAKGAKSPLKALIHGFSPIEELPLEISDELIRLLENPESGACQLACVCFMLAGMVTPYLVHFAKKKKLPPLVAINLIEYFEDDDENKTRLTLTRQSHTRLQEILRSTP